jgi:predicted nuclease of restriction endonuclease-like RecB superfamily
MLTKELAIATYIDGKVLPDRLSRTKHAPYIDLANQMCQVYRSGIGSMRKTLHQEIQKILQADPQCPIRRVGAFCKLLDERSEFDAGKPQKAAQLRQRVFRQAAKLHPLVSNVESILDHLHTDVKDQIAQSENTSWLDLQKQLFSDIIEHHRLLKFNSPEQDTDLLARYNVAQTQAALFDASEILVDAKGDWKAILRYAKLAQLMHRIEPIEGGYRITLDGPASILRRTHRYGFQMAKFLPGLLSCSGWKMSATLLPKGFAKYAHTAWAQKKRWTLQLDDQCGLQSSSGPQNAFDSQIEEQLVENWNLMQLLHDGTAESVPWQLIREGDILVREQRVFFPDFTILTPSGNRVLLEIVGFWTPEYQRHKAQVLQEFSDTPILLAIPKSLKAQWSKHNFSPHHRVIYYGQEIFPGEIIQTIEENRKTNAADGGP